MAKKAILPPFTFNDKNERAQAQAIKFGGEEITVIGQGTKKGINQAISIAIDEGIPPYESARTIQGTLKADGTYTGGMAGLNEPQVRAAYNYRQSLINSGMSIDRVNSSVDKYQDQLLRQRSRTVARTETINALEGGKQAAWEMAEDENYLIGGEREWIASDPCVICAALDGKRIGLREDFQVPADDDVAQLSGQTYDHPTAHPNCECTVGLRRVKGKTKGGSLPPVNQIGSDDPLYWAPAGGWQTESMSGVGDTIRRETLERGGAWDQHGRFVGGYSSNQANRVKLPSQTTLPGGKHIHNHPNAGAFSPGDIDTAAWFRLGETRVVTVLDGKDATFRARGFDKLTKDAGAGGELGQEISDKMSLLYKGGENTDPIMRGISYNYSKGVYGEEATQEFVNTLMTHHINKTMATEYGYSYSVNWAGEIAPGVTGTLDDALSMAEDTMRRLLAGSFFDDEKKAIYLQALGGGR